MVLFTILNGITTGISGILHNSKEKNIDDLSEEDMFLLEILEELEIKCLSEGINPDKLKTKQIIQFLSQKLNDFEEIEKKVMITKMITEIEKKSDTIKKNETINQ